MKKPYLAQFEIEPEKNMLGSTMTRSMEDTDADDIGRTITESLEDTDNDNIPNILYVGRTVTDSLEDTDCDHAIF